MLWLRVPLSQKSKREEEDQSDYDDMKDALRELNFMISIGMTTTSTPASKSRVIQQTD